MTDKEISEVWCFLRNLLSAYHLQDTSLPFICVSVKKSEIFHPCCMVPFYYALLRLLLRCHGGLRAKNRPISPSFLSRSAAPLPPALPLVGRSVVEREPTFSDEINEWWRFEEGERGIEGRKEEGVLWEKLRHHI